MQTKFYLKTLCGFELITILDIDVETELKSSN